MQKLGAPALVIVAVLLVVGFLAPGGCPTANGGGSMSAAAGTQLTNPVLKVGESQIFAAEAETVVSNMRAQAMTQATQRQGAPELTPFEFLSIYMQAMSSLAQQAAVLELGRLQGIKVDEDAMRAIVVQMHEDQVSMERQQFEFMQAMQVSPMEAEIEKLKKAKAPADQIATAEKRLADAKAMTFDKMFQEREKATPQEYVDRQVEDVVARAGREPVIARSIEATAIQSELNERYGKSVDTSDAAVKASYDKIVFKQIMLTGENAESKAEEVLAKIKAGMDFDQAAKQFSMLKKPDGSVQLDTTIETRIDMIGNEFREPILDLKVNEVSEVVESGGSAYIYKLIAVRPEVPENYEATKEQRITQLRNQQVASKLNEAIMGLVGDSGEKVQWLDAGLDLLSDYMNTAGEANQVETLEAVLKKAEGIENTLFSEIPPLVTYAAINQLQVEIKDAAKKKELEAKLLKAFEEVVSVAPSIDLRFQYINALIPAGKGDRALELLLDNAVSASTLGEGSEAVMTRVEQLLPKVSNQATKGNETIGEIQEEIKRWRDEEAERKRVLEEERKRNEQEEAELRKEEAAAPSGTTPPAVPSPTPAEPEPREPARPGSGG